MSAYPIVGRKTRDASELPKAGAHEALVYRVQGRHVVDKGQLGRDSDVVVGASHVSVVDVSAGVPVTVSLTMPSAEASNFTVQVTFACTVIDPARVVRENIRADAAILAYLRRDQKLVHLGLPYRMTELNAVRREVHARIRAYAEVKPPDVQGMQVVLDGVEVLTPDELASFQKARWEARRDHVLETEKRGYSHEQESVQEEHQRRMEARKRRDRHEAAGEDQEAEQAATLRDSRHKRMLRAEEMEFAQREVEQAMAAFGDDPLKALIYAQRQGEINIKELAGKMSADLERQDEYRREQLALDRADERQEVEWSREREREDREDRNRAREAAREDKRLKREAEREDRRLRRQDAQVEREAVRAELERLRQEEREDRHKQMEVNVELVGELAKRGHLDMVDMQPERLVEKISGLEPNSLGGGRHRQLPAEEEQAALEGRPNDAKASGDGGLESDEPIDIDVEVNEEDD
ncbi:hypothetical protein GCM10009557_34030 [Virgisporangium ochraceum]